MLDLNELLSGESQFSGTLTRTASAPSLIAGTVALCASPQQGSGTDHLLIAASLQKARL
jgi:hypothetical protein